MSQEEAEQAAKRVTAIFDSLQNGTEWGQVVRNNSDDRSTIDKEGELPWVTSGQMIPEFENAAYAIAEVGEIHPPLQSSYGWHIIKLLGKKDIGSFEEEKPNIIPQFSKGPRDFLQKEAFISFLKKEYHYEYVQGSLNGFYPYVDSSVFSNEWEASSIPEELKSRKLFTSSAINGSYKDFADFLANDQSRVAPMSLRTFVDEKFKTFVDQSLWNYEDRQLENKYPDFAHIVQEYHDGILLFDLTDKLVWSQAVKDTAGLEKYYSQHASEYKWPERAEAYTVIVKDSSKLAKALKLTSKKARKKDFNQEYLRSHLCPEDTLTKCVELIYGKYEKGENEEVDKTNWKPGLGKPFKKEGEDAFVFIISKLKPSVKKLDETRGQVTADYQKFLEDNWISDLRDKYEVKVNEDVLKKIKQ